MKAYYDGTIPWLKTGDLNDDYIKAIPERITEKALEDDKTGFIHSLAHFCNWLKENCYICKRACIPYAELVKKENRIMAKPIKETPVLYDEDAYRFEMAAQNVVPLSEEKREEIFRNYEEVRSWCAADVL